MNVPRFLVCAIAFAVLIPALSPSQQPPIQKPDLRRLLGKLNQIPSDPCDASSTDDRQFAQIASAIFDLADNAVVTALNAPYAVSAWPRDRAAAALRPFEQASAEINAAWPDASRLHFHVVEFQPALVITVTLRRTGNYFALGAPQSRRANAPAEWQSLGSGAGQNDLAASTSLELYPLRRGPSGNPRFLAKVIYSGCAGSLGLAYDAEEWDPSHLSLTQIIHQQGSLGLGEERDFPQVGKLETEGAIIHLPYCWFSPIDTWDNPSLCALDTYDMSADAVVFRGRRYNRPDLLPVSKALEYAQAHDLPAVRGYCATDATARALVRAVTSHFFADELKVARLAPSRERIEAGDGPVFLFDVEQRAGRWLIAAFRTK